MIKRKKGRLYFDNLDILKLVKKIPTPFFLFSETDLKSRFREFKQSFGSHYSQLRIDFSAKTNYELAVLKILKNLGSHLEIASGHELFLAKKAGFSGQDIVFDGPCKSREAIEFGLQENLHAFNIDSEEDFLNIAALAKKKKKEFRFVVRVSLKTSSFLSGIADQAIRKFGLDSNQVIDLVRQSRQLKGGRYLGLSAHIGSQILAPSAYLKVINKLTDLAFWLEKENFKTGEISLGGGYPSQTLLKRTLASLFLIPVGVGFRQKPRPLKEFGQKISTHFSTAVSRLNHKPIMVLQPGRSISSEMGIGVTQVKVVKAKWVFLDISTSSLPESLFFAQREIILAGKTQGRKIKKYSIAGSGLNTADNFALSLKMPELKPGDILVILDAGAYSLSRANRFTILNPPAYLIRENGRLEEIRRREIYEDVLAPMIE